MAKFAYTDKWGVELRMDRRGAPILRPDRPPVDSLDWRAREAERTWIPVLSKQEMKAADRRREAYNVKMRRHRLRAGLERSGVTRCNAAIMMVRGAAERAVSKGVPFSISPEWAVERLKPGKCEVTGIPFDFNREGLAPGVMNPFAPSLDRKTPKLGYTEENTRIVIWLYNAAKGGWTDENVLRMAEALVARKAIA